MSNKPKTYPQLWPNIEDWPIFKIHQQRSAFVKEIVDYTFEKLVDTKSREELTKMVAKTAYLERIRMKEEPWKVDPPKDKSFWKGIRSKLVKEALDKNTAEAEKVIHDLLKDILVRYTEEIVGTFNKKVFLFARKFLTFFFTRLLNTAAGRRYNRIWSQEHRLSDKIITIGEVEKLRELMKIGHVVVAPTHFSNLDSILIGYALDGMAGLPAFSYGAGLNLYNSGYAAYFMNRLGAYRVDRRKKNPIYLETLKSMSKLSIRHGVNNIFFPGGTRSRSGALEDRLKLGLLGTAIEAQESLYRKEANKKVFVVPIVLSYHFVLEAQHLIEQYLRRTGKEEYIVSKDAFYSVRQLIKFTWKLFSKKNTITVAIGQALDVLGNPVNEKGLSFDQYNNQIDTKDYFISRGEVSKDTQRNHEYTKTLADAIVKRFHIDNFALSSHLVAFAAFEQLKLMYKDLGLYGLLRLPADDVIFDKDLFRRIIQSLQSQLIELEKEGQIKLSPQIKWDTDKLIKDGILHLGSFHAKDPLKFNKKGELITEDIKVLYYYHNRMTGYKLEESIPNEKIVFQEV